MGELSLTINGYVRAINGYVRTINGLEEFGVNLLENKKPLMVFKDFGGFEKWLQVA